MDKQQNNNNKKNRYRRLRNIPSTCGGFDKKNKKQERLLTTNTIIGPMGRSRAVGSVHVYNMYTHKVERLSSAAYCVEKLAFFIFIFFF